MEASFQVCFHRKILCLINKFGLFLVFGLSPKSPSWSGWYRFSSGSTPIRLFVHLYYVLQFQCHKIKQKHSRLFTSSESLNTEQREQILRRPDQARQSKAESFVLTKQSHLDLKHH